MGGNDEDTSVKSCNLVGASGQGGVDSNVSILFSWQEGVVILFMSWYLAASKRRPRPKKVLDLSAFVDDIVMKGNSKCIMMVHVIM